MIRLKPPVPICDDAELSPDGLERLWLSRKVAETGPVGLVIGLNPSVAGAVDTDHTITKLKVFTASWGWSGFWMANLFTHIDTYSANLKNLAFDTAVGPWGTPALEALIPLAQEIVVCWGAAVPKQKAHRAELDRPRLRQLVDANVGKRGFTFSHKQLESSFDKAAVFAANQRGFTINLSADSLEQADARAALGVGPVAVVLPENAPAKLRTPAGRPVFVCPAQTTGKTTCASCQLCARPRRTGIVGFRSHGAMKRTVNEIVLGERGLAEDKLIHIGLRSPL